jgi:CheY-like chemotaxis protein
MPEMTGIEAAIAILAQRPFCRVVLISGHAAIADLLHEPQAQEHSFEVLTKPVHPARRGSRNYALATFRWVTRRNTQGPGRILAIVQGIYAMAVWLPFFSGRVLLHLHDYGMPLANCR